MAFATATVRSTTRALSSKRGVTQTTLKSLSSSFSTTCTVSNDHAKPTSFATKCASLYHPSPKANRGVAPPIYFGSTYTLDNADHGARLHDKTEGAFTDDDGFVYSRWGSPTNEACAKQIAALEGVEDGRGGTMLFGSGMSGITSALMSVLKTGDHAVFPYTVYGGTHEFLKEFAVHWGIEIDFIDGAGKTGPENYRSALRENTKVVYCETPANPTCRITDLKGVGKVVNEFYGTRQMNANRPWVMVDGTFATPYHMRPLDFDGIDVSIQSCTKYLGGHSDILAGSVSSNSSEFCHGLAKVHKLITAPLNPMDSYLLMRGIRTLDVRMQRHGENAEEIDMSHSFRSDGLDESTSSSRWGIIFQRKKNHRDISSSDVSQSEEPHQPNTFKEAMNDTATGKGRRVRSNARQLRSQPSNRNFLSAVCFATEEEEDLDAWCNDRSFVKELKVLQDQDRAVAQATTHQEGKHDSDSTDEDQHQDTDQSIAIQRIISRREAMKRYRASMASNGANSWY